MFANAFAGGVALLLRILSLLVVLGICSFTLPAAGEEDRQRGIRMLCLNVGKGDAILISLEGRHYLIDTGYKRTWKSLRTMLERESVRHLDAVFITHPHKDHAGGLEKLLQSGIPVDQICAPRLSQVGCGEGHPAVLAAAEAGKQVRFLHAGDHIPVSHTAYFEVLGPIALNTDNDNNNSLVMNLVSRDGVILLTGDMKAEEELTLLKADVLAPCDVLKVPFHGKSAASTNAFLRAVRPKVSVISTSSKEEKDTPARDTLDRLASAGSRIYVTQDAPEAVLVELRNKSVSVRMLG